MAPLSITITQSESTTKVSSSDGDNILFTWLNSEMPQLNCHDFAAFLFLPIAMTQGRSLFVSGAGSESTRIKCEQASDAWSTLLPEKYRSISVSFAETRIPRISLDTFASSLMFYSGGVDSTYSLLDRSLKGKKQDLITIKGMDYKYDDENKFELAIEKTNKFANKHCNMRHFISCNAYKTYKKYGIRDQLSHVFLLSASGFMYNSKYNDIVIASDLSYEQQIKSFPVGSTYATNRFFDSGDMQLTTESEDVTRSQKLNLISSNINALESLSFCKNQDIRPENCGICSKCVRTKLMFIASIGFIPPKVFINPNLPSNCNKIELSSSSNINLVFIKDIYTTAYRNGNLDKLQDIATLYESHYINANKNKGFIGKIFTKFCKS